MSDELRVASKAAPPSPVFPDAPVPAAVVMVPFNPTRRMRLLALSAIYKFPIESSATFAGWLSRA